MSNSFERWADEDFYKKRRYGELVGPPFMFSRTWAEDVKDSPGTSFASAPLGVLAFVTDIVTLPVQAIVRFRLNKYIAKKG